MKKACNGKKITFVPKANPVEVSNDYTAAITLFYAMMFGLEGEPKEFQECFGLNNPSNPSGGFEGKNRNKDGA